jgi:hypothetical protein
VVGVHSTCAACPLVFAQQEVSMNLRDRSEFVRRNAGGEKRKHKQFSFKEKCKILEVVRKQGCQAERERDVNSPSVLSRSLRAGKE